MNRDELDQRTVQLAATFADRLDPKDAADVAEYADVGEWGEAIDLVIACLTQDRIPVTPAERDELAALLTAMGESTSGLANLTVGTQT